jgi:WD40 repeat protein
LVKPDTIEGPFEQYGNLKMDTTEYQFGIFGIRGQCCFSPDGNYFACTEGGYTGAQLFKFDRCNGSISDYHFFKQVSFDTTVFDYSVGVCFSPDSKLLYLISGSNVFQYEIKDTTKTSGIHISGMDTIPQFFPLYSLSYLGPDNKLYIGNKNGTQKGMSYIDKPNERGLACDYRPKGLRQPFTNLQVPPNLPFYGLGVLKGSLCDTIKPPSIPVSEIKIYPNPTSEKLTLEFPQNIQNAEITIFNMLGQQVYLSSNSQILNNKMEFSVSHLARALYSIKIVTDGEQFVGKFVRE